MAAVDLPAVAPGSRASAGHLQHFGARAGWLVSPWFDLLLVANLYWPIVLAIDWVGGSEASGQVRFWQIYFITTPHRWLTLALVFLDRNRFRQRPVAFPLVAAVVIVLCGGVWLTTGRLTCLLAIDYVWNAWHFASQHHGVYRIYARRATPDRTAGLPSEKWLVRALVVYVAMRIAGWSWSYEALDGWLQHLDYVAALIPVWLVLSEARFGLRRAGSGRIAYLLSLSALYLGLLWAVHEGRPRLVLALATASALFHATEYLAIVTWSVQGKRTATDRTLWTRLVGQWGLFLLALIAVLGVGGWLMDNRALEAWLFVNVVVAFLHYAYDGMIWKSRPRRGTA